MKTKVLLPFLILTTAVIVHGRGHCMDNGALHGNDTWWKQSACTTCYCASGIVTCDHINCKDPQCDAAQGQSMVIPPNECCPKCISSTKRHCLAGSEVIAHNTEWETDNCTMCTCDDGAILCSVKECVHKQCGYGEVLRRVPGKCCRVCVSTRDSCVYERRSYRDGETWSPTRFQRLTCNDGEIIRKVAQCESVVCRDGERAALLKDAACPTCVGRPCIHQGREYASGETLEGEPCRQCVCQSGVIQCESHRCNNTQEELDVGCASGERITQREGECCSECVSTQEPCEFHGRRFFHGDLWNISKCEVAFCSHGNVRSSYVQCSPVSCKWNEKLVRDSCCPECVPVTSSCRHAGFDYRHGDVWSVGSCKTCECSDGRIQCYVADCPACPERTVPVNVPGECCPDCQPVTCHVDCLTCTAPGYGHCSSCPGNRLLQEGKCFHRCLTGFYRDGKECRACDQSCRSCSGGDSPALCTSCRSGMLLQRGRCVRQCENGYFREDNQCTACPKGCESCSNSTHCTSCSDRTRLPQVGACVRKCGTGFFYDDGFCAACHPSCETCSGGPNDCRTCSPGRLLEKGLCVDRCGPGHYQISISRCAACHSSCASCVGKLSHQCSSCVDGKFLFAGRCLLSCPPRHYAADGKCRACHSTCLACRGSSALDCLRCTSTDHVIQSSVTSLGAERGACRAACQRGYYSDGSLCKGCADSCLSCRDSSSCSSCPKDSVLSLARNKPNWKQCLDIAHCHALDLTVDSSSLFCYDVTSLTRCSARGLDHVHVNGSCFSACPSGTFSKTFPSGTLCIPCDDKCSSCRHDGRCLTCEEGTYLSRLTGQCVASCEFGYYPRKGRCVRCPGNCASCQTDASSPQPRCTSCMNADAVLQHGQCVSHCVSQFYVDRQGVEMATPVCRECDWSCTACSGPSSHDCLECMEAQKLQNGTCVSSCEQGFYESSGRCISCSDKNCLSCSAASHCSRCRHPYYLHENKCFSSCPRRFFADASSGACVVCPGHCLTCSSAQNCTLCDDRTYLLVDADLQARGDRSLPGQPKPTQTHIGTCVRQCGRGYVGKKKTRVCQPNRHAPSITVDRPLLPGIGTRVLVNTLQVRDQDTPDNDLFVVLIMAPSNGWFEIGRTKVTSDGGKVPYRDIRGGNFWFVHDSTKRRRGVATFKATDGSLESQVVSLEIAAVPLTRPVITKNNPVILGVGETSKITPATCFNVSCENDLVFTLPLRPKHGKLVKLPDYEEPISTFQISDLRAATLMYVANSNLTSPWTVRDSIVLQISDEYHVINTVIDVSITPKGNRSSVVTTSRGTHVRKGGLTRITNQHLLTIAPNVKDKSNIVYVLRPKEGSRSGRLVLMVPEMSDAPYQYGIGINEWMRNSLGQYQSPALARFSQRDVDEGHVWYSDEPREEEEEAPLAVDTLEFEVYDDSSSTSKPLGSSTFQVNRIQENVAAPRLSPGLVAPLQMSASEGMASVLHSGFLRFTDSDTPDRDIVFNITSPLPTVYGQIENVDYPHVPVTVFTQSDIDSNKIIYRPPVGGLPAIRYELNRYRDRSHRRQDNYRQHRLPSSSNQGQPSFVFDFTVSDGRHVLPATNFTINLLSSATATPVLANHLSILDVTQGGTATIGDQQLSVSDHDTPINRLVFTLVKAPRHGNVIRNDRGSRRLLRVGATFTNEEINRGSIHYVHSGDRSSPTDQIQVSVTDGIHTIVGVIQVSIMAADSSRAPSPDPFSELSVVVEESSEVTLARENLAFVDLDSRDNQIVYHIETEAFHGILKSPAAPLVPGATFTQEDVNYGRIQYSSRTEIGNLPLTDMVHFHVTDAAGNTLSNQVLTITITPLRRQHPPTVTVAESIEVGYGKEVLITTTDIVVTDPDTASQDLIVRIIKKPIYGNLINRRSEDLMQLQRQEDMWFTVSDLLEGFISYAHSRDLGGAKDRFTFRVVDGHSSTPAHVMNIEIETPQAHPILQIAPLLCRSGHAIIVDSDSLTVVDRDSESRNLVFTLASAPSYGKLVKFREALSHDMAKTWRMDSMSGSNSMKMKQTTDLVPGSTFTYQDVLDQLICYENTVAEPPASSTRLRRTRRDALEMVLSDGTSRQNVEMLINVEPKLVLQVPPTAPMRFIPPETSSEEFGNEELRGIEIEEEVLGAEVLGENAISFPDAEAEEMEMGRSELVVEANTGMTVERGSITPITRDQLRVTGSDRMISFIVTRDPNVGKLQYAKGNVVDDITADGNNQFTQEEIDEGSIRYNHPVSQGGGDVFFMFDIIGDKVDLRFDIHVNEDRMPPKILANRGITVKEGGSKKITTRQLSASDESGRMVFEITQPPRQGRVELTNSTGSTSSFTQADLAAGNVRYVHTGDSKRTSDQFTFSLSDGTNSVTQTFNIQVDLVDNSLPVVENVGIRVQEGVRKTITEFELKATDSDTSNELIRFEIVIAPQHGTVDRTSTGRRYLTVTSFTMADIYESRISYNHDGTNSLTDTFQFKVTDGTNEEFKIASDDALPTTTTEAQLFHIRVVPVDDGTPRLLTNLGINHLEFVDQKAQGVISQRALLTEDPDTEPDRIIYTVTSDPRHGFLESTQNEGEAIRSFTQADINSGLIHYVLSDLTTSATRDSFMFNVRDSLPNVVTGNTFNIKWIVISFDKSNYTVNEEMGTVDIAVRRRGNLNHYAIVLCSTSPGTATSSTGGSSPSSGQLDYTHHAGQVQFDVYETEKFCSIQINDDLIYEGTEFFTVSLSMPTYSLLGNTTTTTVYINDQNDTPTLQFLETQFTVEERDTTVFVPIKRTGDVEKPVTVVCFTESKTATGSTRGRVESGSDFLSRPRHSQESVVTFAPGVSRVNCDVKIVDDSLYENSEEFIVKITSPSEGAKIGKFLEATVTITGPNDSPIVSFTDHRFEFSETAGTVDVLVQRSGTDLSVSTDVWCSTKQDEPVSAAAGTDFVATSTKITFRPEETTKICSMTILDDSRNPIVEGNETFVAYLNSIQKAKLGNPHEALVIINDAADDVPQFEFSQSTVDAEESAGFVALTIQRNGDVSGRASVICYTRQGTASAEEDFVERPRTEMSRIVFEEGQRAAVCNVTLSDDGVYEASETFTVKLADAAGEKWYGARVGDNDQVRITVSNPEDAPTLQFEMSEYSIREPEQIDSARPLIVTVIRTGDASEVSKVRCSTRDGSAKSGHDYEPKSRLLRFRPGETSVTFEVNILSNEDAELHETFLIVLGPQEPVNAVLGETFQTTVAILDKDAASSLVLPAPPIVVSLLHYDDVELGSKSDPSPGYPIVCVTPCDSKYPNYLETRNLCEEAAINASAIRFSWEVAMPADEQNSVPPFETVTDNTPFTSVNTKVLDSIYFGRRFHVRCVAQAVDSLTNTGGKPLRSNVVTIATDSGLCHNPIVSGSSRNFQAQSFIANLNYVSDTEEHPNTLHISVKIPHQDGRLPLISTMPLSNLKLLLARSVDRQQHVCSNLMYTGTKNKSSTDVGGQLLNLDADFGFIEVTDYSTLSLGPGYDKPYQFDPTVREPKTIDLYKHLNLKSCVWQFDAYYHMNELIDHCNGKVESDFQLRDAAKSQVTVTVPLYVSYVYVTAPRGWGALEHQTEMEVSFRYSNVLWRTGIQTDGVLTGRIQVERLKIRDDGKLVIKFKTQTKFRGLFVQAHRTLPNIKARVVPPDGMNIDFKLTNLWSENTYDSPHQLWQAVSTYSRKDYSGDYTVELLPCAVSPTQKWQATLNGETIPCTATAPQKFNIPIMFQQTNRPVPVVYTLHTEFQLYNNEKVFMMDPRNYDQEMSDYDYKGSYTKGQTIFGRVLWTPKQDLKSAYRLQLEKVYLCTGRDGFVPYFDPTGEVYGNGPQHGCVKPNKNLQHRFLLLDRSNRDAEDSYFHDISFDAIFASDRSEFAGMSDLPGVDGFALKVDALYKVEAGHQWYLQVLYVIGSESALPRVRRSAVFGLPADEKPSRRKRSDSGGEDRISGWLDGEQRHNGTNMKGIVIDQPDASEWTPMLIGIVASVVVFVLAIAALVCACCICGGRKKKRKDKEELQMVALKTGAIEKGDDSDEDEDYSAEKNLNQVKVITFDKYHTESTNNRADVQVPLVSKRSGKAVKPNNARDCEKPLLNSSKGKKPDFKIVNNLKSNRDSGTEV